MLLLLCGGISCEEKGRKHVAFALQLSPNYNVISI